MDMNRGRTFANAFWKPVMSLEMKSCGNNLQKHDRQAIYEWMRWLLNPPDGRKLARLVCQYFPGSRSVFNPLCTTTAAVSKFWC